MQAPNLTAHIEKTTTLALTLRQHIASGWVDDKGKTEAEALRRALARYLKAIGE